MIGALLGGVGLFLLGMSLLTDGLQAVAGDSLRTALRRFTRTRLSGMTTGAAVTALVQSSSVTTLATIGFVGAGLIPFAQALGVIYGANVGTTTTGWLVAAIGLKVRLSLLALPMVGLGALAKLFLSGRRSALGTALAGFGLIFVGIDVLQAAMAGLAHHVDPARYAAAGPGGYLLLVVIGVAMTVVMQSSSAAVATTLTAVHGGALELEQAAAVVIGQNMGTTVKALIAAAGGSVPVRRIALAHVLFNVGTGLLAVGLLPLFVGLIVRSMNPLDPATALAAFHTAFNLLGVLLFLPWTPRLVTLLERVVPETGRSLTARLSRTGAGVPGVAVEAARLTAAEVAAAAFQLTRELLAGSVQTEATAERREEIRAALLATREHLRRVRSDPATPAVYREHVSVLHALDHLHRLLEALGDRAGARAVRAVPVTQELGEQLRGRLAEAGAWLQRPATEAPPPLEETSRGIARVRTEERHRLLDRTALGELTPEQTEALLGSLRWIDRVGYHVWRALHHLERAGAELPEEAPPAPVLEARRGDENFEVQM